MKNTELIAVFNEHGFVVDREPTNSKVFFDDEALCADFANNKYLTLFSLGFAEQVLAMSPSLTFLYVLSQSFINQISQDGDREITGTVKPPGPEMIADLHRQLPYVIGMEHISDGWITAVWNELTQVFAEELRKFDGSPAEYLQSRSARLNIAGRVFFHLVENREADCPFAFMATYSTGEARKVSHLPLKNALLEYRDDQEKLLTLLSTVSRAAERSGLISELTESGELFSPLRFQAAEAYTFLQEIPVYEECGIICRIPNWWKRKGNLRVTVSFGDKLPTMVGTEALIDFSAEAHLNDSALSRAELEALLLQAEGLSLIKGKWVEVNHDKLRAALLAFDRAAELGDLTFAAAMRLQLGIDQRLNGGDPALIEITNGMWLKNIRERMYEPSGVGRTTAGPAFKAELRQYQQTGLEWLCNMKKLGFGALLADDMGLGKTVQILALLEYLRTSGQSGDPAGTANETKTADETKTAAAHKTLLIIPASLLCNWQKEADRFTPDLKYTVIHTGRTAFALDGADLFITTYGMAARLESIRETVWDMIILDEAQAVKNAGTKQAKAIKELQAAARIAMTGTPLENRLSDMWSIFDFLNRGLLGSKKEFTAFSQALKSNRDGYGRLREMVGPFILRRLKTDKRIISDLPDKIEIKAYTGLSKKQVALYQNLVKELQAGLDNKSDIARKGLILAGIMKCKQICNHPDQYLGQNGFNGEDSGKFVQLAEICATIAEKRERVLIFTQFKEMTEPLAVFLETVFGRKGLVLHGGTPVRQRGELVARFNGEEYVPFMVLSLKAGGVGLNLTAANHVIHFDRWWNPATENQATDRAFRIGQRKNVMVHKFVTTGTIEEKIDAMITEKQKLADDIVAESGENWLTEMSNDELFKMFKLEV